MLYEPYVYISDMRALEQCAVNHGMTWFELMDNAGSAAAKCLISENIVKCNVWVLCGTGNNGGDGYVIARCLAECFPKQTIHVVALGGEPRTESALHMYKLALTCANLDTHIVLENNDMDALVPQFSKLTSADVLVDAVFGIGFHGSITGLTAYALQTIKNSCSATVVAVDVPSGMEADSGFSDELTLRAQYTLTFAAKKRCMLLEDSCCTCGTVYVCDIGISADLLARYCIDPVMITVDMVKAALPVRVADSHKGTYGSVYSLSGSYGMAGATMLSGEAAMRCGAGLLHMFIPKSIYPIVASQLWEAVYHPLEDDTDGGLSASEVIPFVLSHMRTDRASFLCGPGLSQNPLTVHTVRQLLPMISVPMVIDADGLNAFVGHIDEWKAMSDRGTSIVLTPHPLEAARLLSCQVDDIEEDRILSAITLAKRTGATVVLKGHETVVATPERHICINRRGCSGLAKGGSGDVLTGMIASFLAQGKDSFSSSIAAVYLHGYASERVSHRMSEAGMLPTDLVKELPSLLSDFDV